MTTSVDSVPPAAPPAPQSQKSGFERMAGVLFAPAETFADIARKPDILVPLLAIVLISIVTSILNVPRFDFETMFRDQMAQSGRQMSAEDMDRAMPMMTAFAKTTAYASPLISVIFIAVLAAIMLFAFRMMGGEGTYRQAFSATLYCWLPMVVYSIIATIVIQTRDSFTPDQLATMVRSNLGFLADPRSQKPLYSILSSLDIFTFWTLGLFTIAFSYISQFSRKKSAIIVVSLWLVMVVFKAGFAALSGMGRKGPA